MSTVLDACALVNGIGLHNRHAMCDSTVSGLASLTSAQSLSDSPGESVSVGLMRITIGSWAVMGACFWFRAFQ